jgi:DNA replication protein|nr:MAG TPA: Replicative helicase [Caudoviricetes sp.]
MSVENCDVATIRKREELARYRQEKPGCIPYYCKLMTEEELSERRIFLRKVLAPFPKWENLTNEQYEDIRVFYAGSSLILEDGKGYQILLPASGVSTTETEFRRLRSMMPFEFLDAMAKDFQWSRYQADTTEAKKMVNRYIVHYTQLRDRGMGLYIYSGTKGSGKTMLACCLVNEITKRYSGCVKFVNILDFLEMTKKGFNGDDAEITGIRQAGLLVVDDIGVQMSKEWIDTVLYSLVNDRYVNRLPTIYTSNIPIERLKMDDRITDRIESTTYQVRLPEESIRRAVREQEKQKLLQEIENAPDSAATLQRGKETR